MLAFSPAGGHCERSGADRPDTYGSDSDGQELRGAMLHCMCWGFDGMPLPPLSRLHGLKRRRLHGIRQAASAFLNQR